jgi:hypothetical protein
MQVLSSLSEFLLYAQEESSTHHSGFITAIGTPIIAVLLLSSRHYSEKSGKNLKAGHNQIEFDIWAVQINLSVFEQKAHSTEFASRLAPPW